MREEGRRPLADVDLGQIDRFAERRHARPRVEVPDAGYELKCRMPTTS
jgi:hypothetical protein